MDPSMEEEYYVRVRGRVAGPYSQQRLLTMVRRGQLSRVHELSEDKLTWFPASKITQLFPAKPKPADTAYDNHTTDEAGAALPPAADVSKWYYSNDGYEQGPVSWEKLREKVSQGEIRGRTLLWTEGMSDWRPGSSIPDLFDSPGPPLPSVAVDNVASGRAKGADEAFCSECGERIKARAEICPRCGVRQQHQQYARIPERSRIMAALLALLLGGFGVHKFYLGEVGQGVLYLLLCWTFVPAIVAFVEFIVYLSMSDDAFQRKYGLV